MGILFALGTLGAPPALANHIDTADVTDNCTGFAIYVAGGDLGCVGAVDYTITLTPTGGGSPIKITDSILVTLPGTIQYPLRVCPDPHLPRLSAPGLIGIERQIFWRAYLFAQDLAERQPG